MRYRGIELLQAIKDGKIKDFAKIKVFYLGIPTKHILEVTRANLMWKPGEFCVGELWDDEYTFEIIEEKPKKIEDLRKEMSKLQSEIDLLSNEIGSYHNKIHSMRDRNNYMKETLKDMQKEVNYLLEKESK